MAHQEQALTDIPTDIVAALSLADGTKYSLQNLSNFRLMLAEAAAAPDSDSEAVNIIVGGGSWIIEPAAATNIYLWADRDNQVSVSVNEVP